MTPEDRERLLVGDHGEVCTKATAARILSKTPRTITRWINAGIIDSACAGSMVDVRSIARYISQPADTVHESRLQRTKTKYNTEYAV